MTLTGAIYTFILVVLTPEGTSTYTHVRLTARECAALQREATVSEGDSLVQAMCLVGGRK